MQKSLPVRQMWRLLPVQRTLQPSCAFVGAKHTATLHTRTSPVQHRLHYQLHRLQHSQSAVQSNQRRQDSDESDDSPSKDDSCDWQTLCRILDNKQYKQLQAVGRLPEVQEKYKKHAKDVKQSHGGPGPYIKERYLSHVYDEDKQQHTSKSSQQAPSSNPDVKEHISDPKLRELLNISRWTPNEFPYNFTSDVEHSVIWSSRPLSDNEIEQVLDYYKPQHQWHVRYFVNPPEWKSIPEVEHVQIFGKKK